MNIRPNEPAINPAAQLSMEELKKRLGRIAGERTGLLQKIVQRQADGSRKEPDKGYLSPSEGLVGDRWQESKKTPIGEQLAIMDHRVAELFANGQPLTLFGDNLFIDMDLSQSAWPIGARFRLGEALLEVSAEPHDGCSKFARRFGPAALKLTCIEKEARLRGIYAVVIEAGWVRVGERVHAQR